MPIIAALADLPHLIEHATRCGLAGLANGRVYDYVIEHHDLFITNDRHFRTAKYYPVARIAPCLSSDVAPALRALLTSEPHTALIGRRAVLRRDGWTHVE